MFILPDGSLKTIHIVGEIKINICLTLHQVFLVLEFQYNILYIGKILDSHKNISAHFSSSSWSIQDPTTNHILAEETGSHSLYKLLTNFPITIPHSISTSYNKRAIDIQTIYQRLGHISLSKHKHIYEF